MDMRFVVVKRPGAVCFALRAMISASLRMTREAGEELEGSTSETDSFASLSFRSLVGELSPWFCYQSLC